MPKSLIATPAVAFALVIVTVAWPSAVSAAVQEPASPAVLTSSASVTQLEQQLITLLEQLIQILTAQLQAMPHAQTKTTSPAVSSPAATSSVPAALANETAVRNPTATNSVACVAGYHECTGANCLHVGIIVSASYYCITSTNPVAVVPIPAGAVWPSSSCYNVDQTPPTAIDQSADYFGNPLPGECVPDDPASAL